MSSIGDQLGALARGRVDEFIGFNAASTSGRVHAVATVELLGQEWPTAACHTATLGGEVAHLRPTDKPVTCRRCLRAAGAAEPEPHPTLF